MSGTTLTHYWITYFVFALDNAGNKSEARIAIIAVTTSNSINFPEGKNLLNA